MPDAIMVCLLIGVCVVTVVWFLTGVWQAVCSPAPHAGPSAAIMDRQKALLTNIAQHDALMHRLRAKHDA